MEPIVLTEKKELDILINPQRQNLLRQMRIAGVPMTPKQLSDRLGISASSVQHHLKKLVELGVVELSHTERVRGITASYYRVSPRTIRIGGLVDDEYGDQRLALIQNSISTVCNGFFDYCRQGVGNLDPEVQHGDMLTGVVHLGRQEAKELYGIIRAYLDAHESNRDGGTPWEYALVAYPVAEPEDA